MRRMTYFVMALALVLGLAQCKKEQPTPQSEGNVVMITLNVDGGASTGSATNGSRAEVDPPHVTFVEGDTILVASDGKYVGYLVHNGSTFNGNITNPTVDQPLYFYFLGNKIKVSTLTAGTTNECTVNISDQSNYPHLPVISMGVSHETYPSEGNSYTSRLYNKASLMKFNVTTPSTAPICITGMNNTVSVDFTTPNGEDNGFNYSQTGGGVIKLAGGSGEPAVKWAIVLPQATVAAGNAYTEDNVYIGTRPSIPNGIVSNQYLSTNFTMTVNTVVNNSTPLTIEALTDGNIQVNKAPRNGMKYTLNGETFTLQYRESATIQVTAGDKVQFYGNNTAYNTTKINAGTASVKMYGNIMSLVNETNFATVTTLPADQTFNSLFQNYTNLTDASYLLLPAMTLKKYCYGSMFSGCSNLTAAPALPAETLTQSCYSNMFYGCTNLTTAPELHATTLAPSCYDNMFNGCTSLTAAPELSATVPTSASSCYNFMFKGCTSLTTAPELPSMTLASTCYSGMFKDCTSLTTAPVLRATTLVQACYSGMFSGCSNLNSVTCLATDISASNCTYNWLTGVASTGTFTKTAGVTWSTGTSGIPEGWTIEAMAPTSAIDGKFTVNSDGDQVYFSQGNLQYVGTWQFATNQYDYFSSQSDNHRDLFGWGTGDAPNKVSTTSSEYNTWNEWGDNTITNGGTGWRTLSKDEWVYLFNHSTYGFATVAGVKGIIITPDGYAGTAINSTHTAATDNVIDASGWTAYETNGCVFLPASGYRNGTTTNQQQQCVYCWSSTPNGSNKYGICIDVRQRIFDFPGSWGGHIGLSVRLVKDVN